MSTRVGVYLGAVRDLHRVPIGRLIYRIWGWICVCLLLERRVEQKDMKSYRVDLEPVNSHG